MTLSRNSIAVALVVLAGMPGSALAWAGSRPLTRIEAANAALVERLSVPIAAPQIGRRPAIAAGAPFQPIVLTSASVEAMAAASVRRPLKSDSVPQRAAAQSAAVSAATRSNRGAGVTARANKSGVPHDISAVARITIFTQLPAVAQARGTSTANSGVALWADTNPLSALKAISTTNGPAPTATGQHVSATIAHSSGHYGVHGL